MNFKKKFHLGKNSKVDFYFTKAKKWQKEIEQLRLIVLDCGLTEELKWGVPCYTYALNPKRNVNIILIHVFKEYCAVLFFKGALMQDSSGVLIQQTENVQSARQMRFTSVKEVKDMKATLKAFIYEAVEVEKSGLQVPLKKTSEYNVPEEFESKLNKIPGLKKAFNALTPGRQRAYLFHFSQPKLSKTREARVEKSVPQILKGNGLND